MDGKKVPNKEKVDIDIPLEEKSRDELKDVVLYSYPISVPSTGIRALFHYYEIDYTLNYGPKPGSEYSKVPVVDVNSRQINDSVIIVKNLAPVLTGKKLTADQLKALEMLAYDLKVALDDEVLSSCHDICACAAFNGYVFGCMMRLFSCCLCTCSSKHKDTKKPSESAEILSKMKKGKFFHGDKIGPVDIMFFALFKLHTEVQTNAMKRFFEAGYGWREYFGQLLDDPKLSKFETKHPKPSENTMRVVHTHQPLPRDSI
mmetsp:Transcript_20466/g.30627  ORF Transcript_20466/g.30627 Transcript_20466/m.30627 type:complete len:259 (+) Transcript_20466:51-827(+)